MAVDANLGPFIEETAFLLAPGSIDDEIAKAFKQPILRIGEAVSARSGDTVVANAERALSAVTTVPATSRACALDAGPP